MADQARAIAAVRDALAVDRFVSGYGRPPKVIKALLAIYLSEKAPTISALASTLVLTASRATVMVDQLCDLSWARRVVADDHRERLVRLTADGVAAACEYLDELGMQLDDEEVRHGQG